ncbi:ATP-binding protein [Streptomyces specialis]|uniref:ATP-binding protein n=1 Tax=Streptomyces specialis TaxID=498367 RepID=UPI001F3980E3|nr:ATP-binding protein [Streptomyces specialis]
MYATEFPSSHGWALTARSRDAELWRRIVADRLRKWGAPRTSVELACFGVSELLANVVKHAGDPRCRLEVARVGSAAVVSVFDRSLRLPEISRPDWDAESGRGLWLLQDMTAGAGLGFERAAQPWGKRVWFTCDLSAVKEVAS